MEKATRFILWFDEIGIEDIHLVGGKNASLGEMYRRLTPQGVRISNGFAVTAYAYRYLLEKTGAGAKIRQILSTLDTSDIDNLARHGARVRKLIRNLELPDELRDEIVKAYRKLGEQYGNNTDCAVRSSATAEDLPDASFAGQQETYLNIAGEEDIIDACIKCFASLFTNRAIHYREERSFDHFSIALSIVIQKMVRSDLACSGVMFSIDTESGFRDAVFITGAYGLGENVVQGSVNPDEYYVFKPTLKTGFRPILKKSVGEKKIKMVYTRDQKQPTKNITVNLADRTRFVLQDDEILELARMAMIIEDHYSRKRDTFTPLDTEWAKDGETGELYIVQARPETVHSQKDKTRLLEYVLKETGPVIVKGKSVGEKIGKGASHIIKDVHCINQFKKGEVLVTNMTDPDWEPIMKIAAAIVTNRGGRTCHAAIISRELGIPCVVGTAQGTETILDGTDVTVDCSQGSDGVIYQGLLDFVVKETNLETFPETKTRIMMNLAAPDQAFDQSFIPNQGVGLAREEFIINSYIQVHPLALLHYDELEDEESKARIAALTSNWEDKGQYFIDRLAEGIGMIAAAFFPKKVILRLSDFKSNEYANLIGGKQFEPLEENPMIGWRGASRYYSDTYREAFGLECKAILKVRNQMGLTNLDVMIPFPRTVQETVRVIDTMASFGLKKGENGLQVIGMCEVPANVILADQFLDVLDGFSIGTNDLTQLVLGIDRDSELVAHIYDERNDAVKDMVKHVIEKCVARGKYIGICGQAPSDYMEFGEFVVECGIQTMSLNPDTVIKTTLAIAELEKKLFGQQTGD